MFPLHRVTVVVLSAFFRKRKKKKKKTKWFVFKKRGKLGFLPSGLSHRTMENKRVTIKRVFYKYFSLPFIIRDNFIHYPSQ
jgi:putative SOS response-associated peptidase YedK